MEVYVLTVDEISDSYVSGVFASLEAAQRGQDPGPRGWQREANTSRPCWFNSGYPHARVEEFVLESADAAR